MEGFFEEEEDWGNPLSHMLAGAIAGTTEHCGMFPLDTIKTHVQAHRPGEGGLRGGLPVVQAFRGIMAARGVPGFFRGVGAMAAGAAPAHAVYFGAYELFKGVLGGKATDGRRVPMAYFGAGVLATIFSDAVLTPMDAVKQKLQLGARNYAGVADCVRHTLHTQGVRRGFYAGYTTTLCMNVPYSGLYFASYEFLKHRFAGDDASPLAHCLAGGGAGVLAACCTNPLDVAKTRLQTQADTELAGSYRNMRHALSTIWAQEGLLGLTRGILPRMAFHSTSAAICWGTYEYMKRLLS